jgi:tRNA pseudouridine55 synthase
VARVRKIAGERSVGHTGTLDPMATGVLVLLLGKFTRLAQYFGEADKLYYGKIRFGWSTDTYDLEGSRTSEVKCCSDLTLETIQKASVEFMGEIEQVPPPFSAKKISGVPAYKFARKGQEVELRPKRVQVAKFTVEQLLMEANTFAATFWARVSAGTYVRSMAHDLGQKLGVGAHLVDLRRMDAGEFAMEYAHTLETIEATREGLQELFVHPREILKHMPAVAAAPETLVRIRNGNAVNLPEYSKAQLVKVFQGQSELIAIARRVAGTLFQPKVVLS